MAPVEVRDRKRSLKASAENGITHSGIFLGESESGGKMNARKGRSKVGHLQHSFHNQRGFCISRDDCRDDVANSSCLAGLRLCLLQQMTAHVKQRHGRLPGL